MSIIAQPHARISRSRPGWGGARPGAGAPRGPRKSRLAFERCVDALARDAVGDIRHAALRASEKFKLAAAILMQHAEWAIAAKLLRRARRNERSEKFQDRRRVLAPTTGLELAANAVADPSRRPARPSRPPIGRCATRSRPALSRRSKRGQRMRLDGARTVLLATTSLASIRRARPPDGCGPFATASPVPERTAPFVIVPTQTP